MRTVTGVCVRVHTVGVSGFILHAHRTRGRGTRGSYNSLSLPPPLFLFRLFLSSLDWHFKRPNNGENGPTHTPVSTKSTAGGRVSCCRRMNSITISRSIVRSPSYSRRQSREKGGNRVARQEEGDYTPSSRRIELTYRAHPPPDYSHFIFPSFFVFLSRITVN